MANNNDDWKEVPVAKDDFKEVPLASDDWKEVPNKYESPGVSADKSGLQNAFARLQDPNRWKGIAGFGPASTRAQNPGIVADNPPVAVPAGQVPSAVSGLANFLGKNAPLRVGTSTAIGAVRGALDPNSTAAQGAAGGLDTGLGSEALGAGINAVGQGIRTLKTAFNPAATQDMAQEALDTTSGMLKSSEAKNLQEQLGSHSLDLHAKDYMGIDPEVDEILLKHGGGSVGNAATGQAPQPISIPATEVNKIRVKLDQASRTASGTGVVDNTIANKANELRGKLHDLSPEIDQTYQDWAENLQGARKMDSTSNPIAFLSGKGGDRQALIQKAGEATGTNLPEISSQLKLAKPLMQNPISLKGAVALPNSAAYGAGKSLMGNPANTPVDPRVLQALQQALQNKSESP
jgi:hypothetical protein